MTAAATPDDLETLGRQLEVTRLIVQKVVVRIHRCVQN